MIVWGELPPMPDDGRARSPLRAETSTPGSGPLRSRASAARVTALPYSGLISIRVVRYTPQISRIEFYCATNRPLRWSLESSSDLVNWRLVEKYDGTNDPAPQIPLLRDNQKLVTWLLVAPQINRAFYRLRPLP